MWYAWSEPEHKMNFFVRQLQKHDISKLDKLGKIYYKKVGIFHRTPEQEVQTHKLRNKNSIRK